MTDLTQLLAGVHGTYLRHAISVALRSFQFDATQREHLLEVDRAVLEAQDSSRERKP